MFTHGSVICYVYSQTSIHALTCIVHHLESVRLIAPMKLAACVTKTAPPIRSLYARQMEQRMTTNVGTSSAIVGDWRKI